MSNTSSLDLNQIACLCKALGNPIRLKMLAGLIDCCGESAFEVAADCGGNTRAEGLNFGELCSDSDLAASTVSHHIRELREAGLIVVEKRSKQVFCKADLATVRQLAALLGQLAGPAATATAPESMSGCCVIVKPDSRVEVKR